MSESVIWTRDFRSYLFPQLETELKIVNYPKLIQSDVTNLQKDFCIFRIGHDVEEMLTEDVEGVWVVEGEDQDRGLRIFVVRRRDGGHTLHAASVP